MLVKKIINLLEEMAPRAYAEEYDNVGLLCGSPEDNITGILVCHDALEAVIDEAIDRNCNMVVCFHPILFSPIKSLTGKNYVERAVIKAIRNNVAIYAVHTSLDNHMDGVNKIICDALGLRNTKILIPKAGFIRKLVTYTVPDNVDQVRNALFEAGAGTIGNYDHCSFNSRGFSTYRGNEDSNPVIGQRGELTIGDEIKLEVTFKKHQESAILQALFNSHVYEEVAYEIYELSNLHQNIGSGMTGELETPMPEAEFLQMVKQKMRCGSIRHNEFTGRHISKVAVLGGSGSFAIDHAIKAGADAFLTADLKYHDFFRPEGKLLLADIGHYESERYTKNYIHDFLRKKILNFAIVLSEVNTNPVKYL